MPQQDSREQRRRLSELLADIADRHGQRLADVTRARVVALSPEQAILFLELTLEEVDGFDEDMVSDLHNLGYESADRVLAVSRLVKSSGHHKTARVITSLGLPQARAEVLLALAPHGMHLLSVSDDKVWRRAMRLLPEQVLEQCIQSTESQMDLWMAVVSAQDGHMAKRIEEFRAAGRPYMAWIVSGHTLEELEERVSPSHRGRGLTRLEIHRAVRSLDRGEGAGEPDEQGSDD